MDMSTAMHHVSTTMESTLALADHVTREQDERLLEVSTQVRELVTGALAGLLQGAPGPGTEEALDQAQQLLERVGMLEHEALARARS